MMKRLLANVGRSWDKVPKDVAVIQVQKGVGTHTMCTIEANQIHFHSMSYNPDLPIKQSIVLEELTLVELVGTINSMGYVANLTSEAVNSGLTARKSFALLPSKNIPIIMPADISTFTSKLWEMLYPIARLLEDTDNDMDVAIQQMYATVTSGRWLEYWASFFKIKRAYGESDALLSRRMLMALTNLKTTNLAVEELVKFAVQGKAKVADVAPALFSVEVDPLFMDKSSTLNQLIKSIKGAGIDYFLNYSVLYDENYRSYIKDLTGRDFNRMDERSGDVNWGILKESKFGFTPLRDHPSFRLNKSKLVTGEQVMDMPIRVHENPDTYSVLFEKDFGNEVYPKSHHRLGAFKLNRSKTNSTSEGLFAPYHGLARFQGGEVASSYADTMKKSVDQRAGEVTSNTEEHSFRLRKSSESFVTNESKLNGLGHLSPYEERVLEYYVSTAVESISSEVYTFEQNSRQKRTFFRTNKGKLNNSQDTLYGVETYGDIMGMSINVSRAETFPETVESAGREITSSHAEHYKDPNVKGIYGFRIGYSKLSRTGEARLSKQDRKTTDTCSMKMERDGVVVQVS